MKNKEDTAQNTMFIIFKTEDDNISVDVRLEDETVWLSQKQMAVLFDKNVMTINEHIKNVYKEGELAENSTIRKYLIVQKEGNREVSRDVLYYNLDVIISIGYRVKSIRGTQFRIWAIIEGLPKEIELREKQYEYYRDQLLTFHKNNQL